MKKGIPFEANRTLHALCKEKSLELRIEGSASRQMEIRQIPSLIEEYALAPGTAIGVVEVVFPDKPFKGLTELYLQCPLTISFRNFIPEIGDIDEDTLLVKHVIVVVNWSINFKLFKATIDNERMHLMLFNPVVL